ncbi:hypothetical protein [Aeromicrobium sp. UC242_57]|uniref:hypothetical protein n=1 Tax=Aeromicrobium sp. UC242_57 TaxID=3374624 RepID=UPI003791447B
MLCRSAPAIRDGHRCATARARDRRPAGRDGLRWPGLASATVDAAIDGDFPLLAAVTTLTCLAVLIGSALADSVYLFVDPRIDDI